MEPQDIAGLLELGICAAVGYLPMVTAAGYVTQSSLLQERIKSQKHLEEVINEEALKLGLEDQKFRATFPAEFNGFVFDEDHYHICIKDGMMGTCAVVRNQLYLIERGVVGRAKTVMEGLRHLVLLKPKAILYGAFRLKL